MNAGHYFNMRRCLTAVTAFFLGMMLTACGTGEDTIEMEKKDFEENNASSEAKNDVLSKSDSVQAGEAILTFDSFDGGGPEFNVIVDDEDIVTYRQDIRYKDSGHAEIVFTGVKPGETSVLIEERSPIADNLDRCYKISVSDELNVSVEEASVRDINEPSEDMSLYINGEEFVD